MVGLAIAGVVPLTLGAILWLVGTSMRLASHRGWAGRAAAGEALVLIGLGCGLALVIVAVSGWRDGEVRTGEEER